MSKLDVLNGGFVRLVSYMQPAVHHLYAKGLRDPLSNDHEWEGDLEVVRNARVSYNADWRSGEDEGKDKKLVHRLYRNHHTSPFEAMVFTFEVKAPIFVFRQWHRHRTWSYNEVSARYAELDEGYYVPELDQITLQSTDNKQMRTAEQNPNAYVIQNAIRRHCEDAFFMYRHLLERGTPRELARSVLPVGAYSRMFATVDLHNLFHFIRLRDHEHAQYEIRVYAQAMKELIRPIVPHSVEAFDKGFANV